MKTRVLYAAPDGTVVAFPKSDHYDDAHEEMLIIPRTTEEVELGDNKTYVVKRVKHYPPTQYSANLESAFTFLQTICKDAEERDVNPNAGMRCREDIHVVIIVLEVAKQPWSRR